MNPPARHAGYFLSSVDSNVDGLIRGRDSYFGALVDAICTALGDAGVVCEPLYPWEPSAQDMLKSWLQAPPKFILTMNLLPRPSFHETLQYFDLVEAPIVCLLLDHPAHVLGPILDHRRYREFHYGVMDRLHVPFLLKTGVDRQNVFSFPQAGPSPAATVKDFSERGVDILFAGSVRELESAEDFLAKNAKGDPKMGQALLRAVDRILEDRDEDVFTAVTMSLKDGGLSGAFSVVGLTNVIRAVDGRARTLRRYRLFASLSGLDIHFVGDFAPAFGRANPRGIFHEPVSFARVVDMMQDARIVINDTINLRGAALIRFFYAIANGCLVASERNPFIHSEFGSREGVLYLDPRGAHNAAAIKACLDEPALWRRKVEAAMAVQRERHTWRHRVPPLVAALG